jgi:hypothetical protein
VLVAAGNTVLVVPFPQEPRPLAMSNAVMSRANAGIGCYSTTATTVRFTTALVPMIRVGPLGLRGVAISHIAHRTHVHAGNHPRRLRPCSNHVRLRLKKLFCL